MKDITDSEWQFDESIDEALYESIKELSYSDLEEALDYIDFPKENRDEFYKKLGF